MLSVVVTMHLEVKKIAIVGGGTAGWSAAALLAHHYRNTSLEIVLIESPDIASVGVGEATVPAILNVHNTLGIDEQQFIKETQATFKLGIKFKDWRAVGKDFFHPFSDFGVDIEERAFHQCWLKLKKQGYNLDLEDYSLCAALAKKGRFAIPDNESENPLAWYGYAYHFDASLYAKFLREYSENLGVKTIVSTVTKVNKNSDTQLLESLELASGSTHLADFFVDCSGFKSILLNDQYQVGFDDWGDWLPCDSAWVVQTESNGELLPYTQSTAMTAGWKWEIPLQNRTGNGYVFSSSFISEGAAKQEFLKGLALPLINEPRLIRFKTGMRPKFWEKNCAAVGLSSGFVEPLESTSISMMHTGVAKIIAHMPDLIVRQSGIDRANELNKMEYERIRDFIFLHYWASNRNNSGFWRSFSEKALVGELENKITSFKRNGALLSLEQESFRSPSWLAMYNGFGIEAEYDQSVSSLKTAELKEIFEKIKKAISTSAQLAPAHRDFLKTV